jgi:hypothetical protein
MRGVALLLFLASPAKASPERVVLPMQPYGVYPAVEASVNGTGPYLFLIDTGANGKSRLDKSVAAKLRLQATGTATAGTAVASATAQLRTIQIERLELGAIRFTDVPSLVNAYNTVDYLPDIGGILAFDLFADRLLTLDFCKRQVVIDRGELPPPGRSGVIQYEDREGIPYVKGKLGSQQITFLFDTGDIRALDLPIEVLRTQFLANFPRPHSSASGLGFQTSNLRRVELEDPLTIGAATFLHIDATFSPEWHVPIIGSALLRRAVVTFDQKHKRMKINQDRDCRASK